MSISKSASRSGTTFHAECVRNCGYLFCISTRGLGQRQQSSTPLLFDRHVLKFSLLSSANSCLVSTVTFCITHLHVHITQALPVDVDADIEKDVGRTFPNAAR